MDVRPLPDRPSLEQYRKQAKDLVKAHRAGDPAAIQRIRQHHPRLGKLSVEEVRDAPLPLAEVQFTIARECGFESWPQFSKHLQALSRDGSPVSDFERAVDAIVSGDEQTLRSLLQHRPELVRARSTRRHRATLLTYVGANGVEDYRQKTPPNAPAIAKILLEAGAEVDALSDLYGGSTTLGLAATSVWPVRAGVHQELMQVLLDYGASFEPAIAPTYTRGSLINACLANGREECARWLADRGAPLDLEGAAGVGRLDRVAQSFNELGPEGVDAEQRDRGLGWAAEYGHPAVVEFLLSHGADPAATPHGETALHWAAYGGHPAIVKLLLDRGAPLDVKDQRFDGAPLDWAMHGWRSGDTSREPYYEVVELLVRAGAPVERVRQGYAIALAGDRRMAGALAAG